MKSCFDKEGFKTLNYARFFEELKVLIMDAFECAEKETATIEAKVDEYNSTQSFKLA